MEVTMNEVYRLRYTNQIVGVFLLLFLALIIVLSFTVFRLGNRFGAKDRFWIEASEEEVHELHPGTEVLILGKPVGEVLDLSYLEDGSGVRVDIQLTKQNTAMVFEDSVVRLERKFGVGTPVLVIRRDSRERLSAKPLAANQRILSFLPNLDRVDQLSDQVKQIRESFQEIQEVAEPTLESMRVTGERLQGSLDRAVDPAFRKSQEASDSFLQTNEQIRETTINLEGRVADLVGRTERMLDQDVRMTLSAIQRSNEVIEQAASQVGETSKTLDAEMIQTLSMVRETSEAIRQLAAQTEVLIEVLNEEAEDLPGTTVRVNNTMSEAQQLVQEIRSHWLLRRYRQENGTTKQLDPSSIRGGFSR